MVDAAAVRRFQDGNYTANPVWTVSAGEYTVDTKGNSRGLRSNIVPEGVQTGQNITIGNIVIGTLNTGQTGAGGRTRPSTRRSRSRTRSASR